MTADIEKETAVKEEYMKPTDVDCFGYKMWSKLGDNNNVAELSQFVNEQNGQFECFAMREVQTNKIGVALIVPDGVFYYDENIYAFIESANYLRLTLWIREQSFYKEDYRFNDEIPQEALNSPFNEDNKVANKSIYIAAKGLEYEFTKGCVGVCCGPYYKSETWTNDIAVWVFSLFEGLIPLSLMEKFCVSNVVSIRASSCNYQNEHLFSIAKSRQPIQSGLKLIFENREQVQVGYQSLCSFISIYDPLSKVVQKGYLTTMHSEVSPVSECDTFIYSEGSIRNEIKLSFKPRCHFAYDARIKVEKDDYAYTIGADFCIALCDNARKTEVYHKEEILPLVDIVSTTEFESCSLGKVFKSGQATGTQEAVYVNSMISFDSLCGKKECGERTMLDKPREFIQGYAEVFNKHFIIVYSPTIKPAFMTHGDSGGLCYLFKNDSIYAIGICIGKLSGNFYKIIPLSLIELCYESQGYNVNWFV